MCLHILNSHSDFNSTLNKSDKLCSKEEKHEFNFINDDNNHNT